MRTNGYIGSLGEGYGGDVLTGAIAKYGDPCGYPDLEWMLTNGWSIGQAASADASVSPQDEANLNALCDLGFKIGFYQSWFNEYGTVTVPNSTVTANVEYLCNTWGKDGDNGDCLSWFFYELAEPLGAQWLRNTVPEGSVDILWGCYGPMWADYLANPPTFWPFPDINARLALVDAVMIEIWDMSWIYTANGMVDYAVWLVENHPNMPIGLNTGDAIPPQSNADVFVSGGMPPFWTWTGEANGGYVGTTLDPLPTVSVAYERQAYFLPYLKQQIANAGGKPFCAVLAETSPWANYYPQPPYPVAATTNDVVQTIATTPNRNQCLKTQWEWLMGMNLLNVGATQSPKAITPLTQSGVIPAYVGASRCVYPHPVDTFTNTGNEIIMLKSWSGTTTHTITVSGTTPNGLTTTQSYTRTLSPNQGTPLGPFPVDQFGSNPTITYDNNNLYVAILGAWRTGFEPL